MIRSGDRIRTDTGTARRPLTLAEAEAGGLPEPFTAQEWEAAFAGSLRAEHAAYASREAHWINHQRRGL